MTTKDDGGPAFPCAEGETTMRQEGMTLRDWFAGQSLAGIGTWLPPGRTEEGTLSVAQPWRQRELRAEWAYRQADAMIAERNK
jgi:hypothetical protein